MAMDRYKFKTLGQLGAMRFDAIESSIRTKNDFVETIANVFCVSDLEHNLLSAEQL